MSERGPKSGEVTYLNARPIHTAAIIVAAGRGRRLGTEVPKQYLPLNGACALRRSIEQFLAVPGIDMIRTVIHSGDQDLYDAAVKTLSDPRALPPAFGGPTRAATTLNGLLSLQDDAPDRVLIHDAARPFVSTEVILRVMQALDHADGAFAGLPIVDAVWRTTNNAAQTSVPRDGLWRAQTPQGFDFKEILAAHQTVETDAADDVAIARAAGMSVAAVRGSEDNYKITVADDLERALAMLADEPIVHGTHSEMSAE
ncbi:MAG: 2-C-methyl-D-erythritol 4-phosphate cytidylyltransferase [Silicimonas sp.]|nr:2-C-methyl-D-erythritol 4-phosphate cytidylyltransferase [Silicimonas sp.]